MTTKIGIINNGNVGGALERGLKRTSPEVRSVGNDPAAVRAVADSANVVILALGFSTSGAEELQKKAPKAHVVKAFNTVFAQNMPSGHVGTQAVSALVAGDDPGAKSTALERAKTIGFEAVDAGPLRNARLIEPLGYLNIQLGYMLKMGTDIGFKVVRA